MSTATGRSHRVVFNYFRRFALLYRYELAIVVEATVGATTSWRHVDGDQDDGDHGVMPVTMEIMPVLWKMEIKSTSSWPYHVTYDLHVMLILLCILFCLGRR